MLLPPNGKEKELTPKKGSAPTSQQSATIHKTSSQTIRWPEGTEGARQTLQQHSIQSTSERPATNSPVDCRQQRAQKKQEASEIVALKKSDCLQGNPQAQEEHDEN